MENKFLLTFFWENFLLASAEDNFAHTNTRERLGFMLHLTLFQNTLTIHFACLSLKFWVEIELLWSRLRKVGKKKEKELDRQIKYEKRQILFSRTQVCRRELG